MELTLVAVVVVALFFDFTNGFPDTANAIATSVSPRALTPRTAVILAADSIREAEKLHRCRIWARSLSQAHLGAVLLSC